MGRLAQIATAAATIFVPIGVIMAAFAVGGRRAAAVVAVGFFGLVGLGLLLAGAGRLRAWLRLRGADAVAPDGVAPGPVEVTGVARPLGETLDPPRAEDGTESLVYEHVVKKKRQTSDPDDPDRWETTTNVTETVPFVVEGETGDGVVVDPEEADLLLDESYTNRTGSRRERVSRLDPDESVYVAGEAVHATAADGQTDGRAYAVERPATRVPDVLRRIYDQPFVVADSSEGQAERRLLRNGAKVAAFAVFYNAVYVGLLVGVAGSI